MRTLKDIGDIAASSFLKGMPYKKYDCQGYLKAVFRRAGFTKAETAWIGTNDLYRHYVESLHLIRDEPDIPYGAVLLTAAWDEKPPARYKTGPNCKHCGVYIGGDNVAHSTTGGVQVSTNVKTRFNYWAVLKGVSDLKYRLFGGLEMEANRIKVSYKESDGTVDYKILELNTPCNVTAVEVYLDQPAQNKK